MNPFLFPEEENRLNYYIDILQEGANLQHRRILITAEEEVKWLKEE